MKPENPALNKHGDPRKRPAKKGEGRPAYVPDLKQIEILSSMQCNNKEIASVLRIHENTMLMLSKREDVREALRSGRDLGKVALRRAQWKAVQEDGNTTMMIWLGKQWLEQSDKAEFKGEVTGKDGAPLIPTVIRLVGPKIAPSKA